MNKKMKKYEKYFLELSRFLFRLLWSILSKQLDIALTRTIHLEYKYTTVHLVYKKYYLSFILNV